MKRFYLLIISGILLAATISCGEKKPETGPSSDGKTNTVTATPPETKDKFDDTAYKNVIAVLRESIDKEKSNPTPENKLNTAKAYVLVARFIQENIKETRYGFSVQDIQDYKDMAKMKCATVQSDVTATKDQKADADKVSAKADRL